MEQAAEEYWMVMKKKRVCHFQASWEERAFAEDHAALTWPPRSYSCSFCKREFRSAQALGGHMNVHRRDRARLKQSLTHDHHQALKVPDSATRGHDHDHDDGMGTDLCVGLNCSSQTLIMGCKRPKLAVSSLQFSLKPCFQAADMDIELDLELRLGHDPPQLLS